ncbi:phenylalanine--tRNA ligase subunit beta [Alicyclobacillus sp. ALC3]|uniref:phenylalanine--tRNA ligase subunit beta n=1 Tax=Alicyclobacillus sp. ALC3 TaxID=2796143 RepID=UPI00237A008F|nr:phenylalanine--tRNA ligase subunit beta [Alicyclobacillus sp. ALC3]WDL96161.1 phenylalanine--tRNA ligase subunit beta [Alicyclobacillus sp. ALC3]
MKVSIQWLNEYVDVHDINPANLANLLTNAGLAVDAIEPRNQGVQGVVVGHVLTCEQHPNADRLHVCSVDVGEAQPRTIVCGAANVAAGQRVPVALPGSSLPGGDIGVAKLRGIESQGMICSAKELGLEVRLMSKAQTDGILVLPEDAPIGADIVELLGLDDTVLEIDLTPNRSDCLSLRGLAYEVGALLDRPVRFDESGRNGATATVGGGGGGRTDVGATSAAVTALPAVEIKIETPRCSRYEAQVLTGLGQGAAPLWMQMRLLAMGVRPISLIVDVTNYVMLEWGQPLHAFDLDQVHERTIVVRQGRVGEQIVSLDGETRELTEDTIVIADVDRAIGIAGVMGGANSEITDATQQTIIESAAFDAPSVRRTGQRLGLRSEAQQRFEKGVDSKAVTGALERATALLESLSGARRVGEIVVQVSGATPSEGVTIAFSPQRCNDMLGTNFTPAQIDDVFRRLGLCVEQGQSASEWQVAVPTRRPDLRIEADLVEEVGRICGFGEVPSTLPEGPTTVGVRNRGQRLRRATRQVLLGFGLTEVYTYTFSHPAALVPLRLPEDSAYRRMIPLLRPLSDERIALRTHLLPGLAQVAAHNLAHGVAGGQVFEIGKVYWPDALPLTKQPTERMEWAGLWFGAVDSAFGERSRKYDFADVKGVVEGWLETIGLAHRASYEAGEVAWLHPGRTAVVKIDGEVVGSFGELHPETAAKLELERGLYAQMSLDHLLELTVPVLRVQSLPRYPASRRDLAVVVPRGLEVGRLVTIAYDVASLNGDLLESCEVFDVYTGTGVPEGMKSVALALTFRAADRTLTDDDIAVAERAVLDAWEGQTGAVLRG